MTEGNQHPAGIRHSTEPNFTSQAWVVVGKKDDGMQQMKCMTIHGL